MSAAPKANEESTMVLVDSDGRIDSMSYKDQIPLYYSLRYNIVTHIFFILFIDNKAGRDGKILWTLEFKIRLFISKSHILAFFVHPPRIGMLKPPSLPVQYYLTLRTLPQGFDMSRCFRKQRLASQCLLGIMTLPSECAGKTACCTTAFTPMFER